MARLLKCSENGAGPMLDMPTTVLACGPGTLFYGVAFVDVEDLNVVDCVKVHSIL